MHVVDRLGPDPIIDVGEAPEFVVLVLKGVGVDRAETHAQVLCIETELVVVVDAVPGNVQGDKRGCASEAVYLRRIGDLVFGRTRRPGLSEDLEPRTRVSEGPRGQLNLEVAQPLQHVVNLDHVPPARGSDWASRWPIGWTSLATTVSEV